MAATRAILIFFMIKNVFWFLFVFALITLERRGWFCIWPVDVPTTVFYV